MRTGFSPVACPVSLALRILVVNWLDRENPLAGGAEEHLHQIFGRLVAEGHQVTALVSGWPGCSQRTNLDGIDVHRTGSRYTFSLMAPRYYRRQLLDRDFDVVVEDLNKVPLFTPCWVNSPVLLMAHHLFGKTAFQAASVPVAIVTFLLECVIPLFYREIRTIAVSESTRSDLVRRGLRAENVEVIHNGVDLSFYTPQLGSKTVRPTLLFLGRLQRYKRVDLIIEAIANLAVEGVHVHLSIAGAGEQASSLSKLANRLGVDDRVELLGFVTEQMKLDLLRSSWLHVLPSSKEGWGISVIEAAACGTLSVASDAPGLRESVIHEETGLLVRHGDAEALTGAIASLVLDSERRRWMSESARRFAEGYSWDTSAVRVEAVLTQVADVSG